MNHDPVDNPSHYTSGKWEVIEFIEDKHLDFHLGNTIKYISRAGKKDPSKIKEDLKKADWYLRRRLALKHPITLTKGEIDCVAFAEDQKLKDNMFRFFVLFHNAFMNIHSDTAIRACLRQARYVLKLEINSK